MHDWNDPSSRTPCLRGLLRGPVPVHQTMPFPNRTDHLECSGLPSRGGPGSRNVPLAYVRRSGNVKSFSTEPFKPNCAGCQC
jgi:hypothetical protein